MIFDLSDILDRANYWLEQTDGSESIQESVTFDLVRDLAETVERLGRWQHEASSVLAKWDDVHQLLPLRPIDLGRSKADNVAAYIQRIHDTVNGSAA